MLTTTVTDELFQSIAGWDPEILDNLRRMDQLKLPHGRPLNGAIDALDVLRMPDALGVLAAERPDHATQYNEMRQ